MLIDESEPPTVSAHQILQNVFGFAEFRPGQKSIIDTLLDRNNVLVVMPTGSGKSLCFQVPALVTGGLTVVVSPLISLMQDQVTALRLNGIAADSINSANDSDENIAAWRRAVAGESHLLYMAPERLMSERMLNALERLPITMFVVDEAHCISQWGPAFRPEYEDLCRLQSLFPGIPGFPAGGQTDGSTCCSVQKKKNTVRTVRHIRSPGRCSRARCHLRGWLSR